MLRQKYKAMVRRFLSEEIGKYRAGRNLTQEQISERLCMAPRSYAELEHGASGCSDLTVMLFLVMLENEELLRLMDSAREALREAGQNDAA